MMKFGEPEYHKQQSFAEQAIQVIQESSINKMSAQELKTGEISVKWSEDFHDIIRLVDKQWQKDSSKIPEKTQVQIKLLKPISVLGKKLHDVSPKWVENWLNTSIKKIVYTVNKVVADYKNSDEELEHAIQIYLGKNRAFTDKLYKEFMDLADKKKKAIAYQVEIEKIILQGGFAYKDKEKDRIIYNIRMLTDGLDPYKILVFHSEPEE
ncbi:hypothetical protein RclHR1_17810003 [Rhizophagus clarus]|uniref:Uncharacterized protein n=1 Tax=Rhizophagus clarus TaxID=94130 RepID=A0A2Z6QYA3_9GLOM|nr:hypothetical protein RclHR1_17810003 [Rhizophagus clarus]